MNWKIILLALVLVFAVTAEARVVEAQGSARIVNGDTDAARKRAIENALQQALLMTGSSISSVQSIVDGVLSTNQTQVSATGDVERVNIIREEVRGDRMFVVLQAEIWNRDNSCQADNYKVALTVVPFELSNREHGAFGQVWSLGKVAADRLTREIASRSDRIFVSHTLSRNTGLNDALNQLNLEHLGVMAREIGMANDSQYVVFGLFDDLSMVEIERGWGYLDSDYRRNYALTLYLLNASSGELLTRARVNDIEAWTYDRNEAVDVAANEFWDKPFGAALMTGIEDLAAGVRDQLRCKPTRGRIVWQQDNQIQFNLGEQHGVRVGDQLKVVHPSNFVDNEGLYRQKWQVSEFTVEVTQVQHNTAVAELNGDGILTNVQVNDWVIPVER
ncbi:flagellar assembly T-like protein [Idiomarina aquatica]|uniref:Flagellar assembly T-like protein n=1 Tax=Idiomarina aquatica TaxID=1327752 RepID=A0A4R6PPJ7_9GAMM|nr:flagella assembly protein FlgT [Idiomarina aquatica]TDP40319.1 flagellar assembly T-like protein [Idiomarina aquatica]